MSLESSSYGRYLVRSQHRRLPWKDLRRTRLPPIRGKRQAAPESSSLTREASLQPGQVAPGWLRHRLRFVAIEQAIAPVGPCITGQVDGLPTSVAICKHSTPSPISGNHQDVANAASKQNRYEFCVLNALVLCPEEKTPEPVDANVFQRTYQEGKVDILPGLFSGTG